MQSGLRLPVQRIRKRLQKLDESVDAMAFKPELLEFTGKVLTTCIELTPVRDGALIAANQQKEYDARVNYIPSIHWTNEPRMIVAENGTKLVVMNGKWFRPELHHVPNEVWEAFQELDAERERRLQTSPRDFIDSRKQARFLFQKTWPQVARSLQIVISVASQIMSSVTRRWPTLSPPSAYAQLRGGKDTLTVVVFDPLLNTTSGGGATPFSTQRYKPFSGSGILATATARHRPEFLRKVENKVRRLIYAAKKAQ